MPRLELWGFTTHYRYGFALQGAIETDYGCALWLNAHLLHWSGSLRWQIIEPGPEARGWQIVEPSPEARAESDDQKAVAHDDGFLWGVLLWVLVFAAVALLASCAPSSHLVTAPYASCPAGSRFLYTQWVPGPPVAVCEVGR